jgi:hypothetical protein
MEFLLKYHLTTEPFSILSGKEDVRFLRNNCKLALIFTRITKINVIEVIENFPTWTMC